MRLRSEKSGRDGQIRTADLSLRRRPLYPSELRPHSSRLYLDAASVPLLQAFAPDVACGSASRRSGCGARLRRPRRWRRAGRRPEAVTPSTRPPEVSSRPCSMRVPAWNTVAPMASAIFDAADFLARLVRARIAGGGEHHADTRPGVPGRASGRQVCPRSRPSARARSPIHAVHQRLRLRVAQPDVELQHLRAVGRHHQAGVEEAGEVHALPRSGRSRGPSPSACRLRSGFPRRNRRPCRRCSVPGRRRRPLCGPGWRPAADVAAVAQGDEADLFAGQKLLDHQSALSASPRAASASARIVRHDHAFARGQAVGLQHHREAEASQRRARLRRRRRP